MPTVAMPTVAMPRDSDDPCPVSHTGAASAGAERHVRTDQRQREAWFVVSISAIKDFKVHDGAEIKSSKPRVTTHPSQPSATTSFVTIAEIKRFEPHASTTHPWRAIKKPRITI